MFRDNELAHVFLYEKPVEISSLKLQPEELAAADWFDIDVLRRALTDRPEWLCTPNGGIRVLLNAISPVRPTRILFVCHGNICRSPMAELVMKHLAEERGMAERMEIASAATST